MKNEEWVLGGSVLPTGKILGRKKYMQKKLGCRVSIIQYPNIPIKKSKQLKFLDDLEKR